MELKLSNEQIERAAQAVKQCGDHAGLTERLRAAAPYLQAPLAEPTEEEVKKFFKDYSFCNTEFAQGAMRYALEQFVARRNQPPSDPRREAIKNAIVQTSNNNVLVIEETITNILRALDALEVQK